MIVCIIKLFAAVLAFCGISLIGFFILCLIPEGDHAEETQLK